MSPKIWPELPPLEITARLRPIDLISPSTRRHGAGLVGALAPYVAATLPVGNHDEAVTFSAADGSAITGWWRGGRLGLTIDHPDGSRSEHRSRRHGRPRQRPVALGLTLTGVHACVLTQDQGGQWTARGRVGLSGLESPIDPHDAGWLATLTASGTSPLTYGDFGQLGLRDLRFITRADGTPYTKGDGWLWLSATHAGPGFFDTAHTGIWRLHPATAKFEHTSSLWFQRPDKPGVYGDHSTHVVSEGDGWIVATSTWGDFHRRRPAVGVTVAHTTAPVLHGRHRLPTQPLPLPTDGLDSVGCWDPHLVHQDGRWWVAFVSARKFFEFHPALAAGPSLDSLKLHSAAPDLTACEGPTLVPINNRWRLLASQGRDGRRGYRKRFLVFDLDCAELGTLAAPYPTNIPWPTLTQLAAVVESTDAATPLSADTPEWLMVTFDGTPTAGRLTGYGTHGDVVLMREARPGSRRSGQGGG